MKKLILFLLIVAAAFITLKSSAQDYKSALGIRLSSTSPTINHSVTYKHFISPTKAFEGYFSFGDPIAFGAMYQIYKPLQAEGLKWFYGFGGYVGFPKTYNEVTKTHNVDVAVGGMGGVGLDYKFKDFPINLSLDWKPELNIISKIKFEPASLGVSIRYVFK